MKRILVIDESDAVRETLALILGRDFVVLQRPLEQGHLSFGDTDKDVDLLILGITAAIAFDSASLIRFPAQAPFAVLFLVDSRAVLRAIPDREKIGCLAKPFNPYELREEIGRLLARRTVLPQMPARSRREWRNDFSRYVDYPYLSRSAASLVQRFAATHLPILVSGELGCGQERVIRAIHGLDHETAGWVLLNGADVDREYLVERSQQLSWDSEGEHSHLTLAVENLDKVPWAGQALLLQFLDEQQEKLRGWRLMATSQADLLERVYRGEYLNALYYQFATLNLTLPPLRNRKDDIPALANWFGQLYARRLRLSEVSFTAGAVARLCNYLWFGNLSEMETVIARTLAVHRKPRIDAPDLIFDLAAPDQISGSAPLEEFAVDEIAKQNRQNAIQETGLKTDFSTTADVRNGSRKSPDIKDLIHELAHELKNPMVTIKTFAQLLADRYEDESFRVRFHDVVDGDIERMDDLLEAMIEFADFSDPHSDKIHLETRLRSVIEEVAAERAKRQAQIIWKCDGSSREILADEAQLRYVLKNVLVAIFSQAKTGSEIEIDVARQGCVAISYRQEGFRVMPVASYLNASAAKLEQSVRPLRILLAQQLVERNGGCLVIDHADDDRDIIRLEFPIA
jgi:DNA-binding NtrC family response regulator